MTDKEKIHQILSSLWKNDDSVGKMCYNQALQDVQTAIDLQEEPKTDWLQELQKRLDSLSKEDFKNVMAKYSRYGEEEPVSMWHDVSEEPVSEEWVKELRAKLDSLSKEDLKKVFDKYAIDFNEEPISEGLEKELRDWRHIHFQGRRDHDANGDYLNRVSQLDLAKHFFALGLKTSNPLTWEDIKTIDKLLNQCVDYSNPYQEVLKRFKAQKGESV